MRLDLRKTCFVSGRLCKSKELSFELGEAHPDMSGFSHFSGLIRGKSTSAQGKNTIRNKLKTVPQEVTEQLEQGVLFLFLA